MDAEYSNANPIVIPDTDNARETDKRPIVLLFKRLIKHAKEQNIMLTNTQLIEILQTEFNINISEIHELEVDIYLSVIKKFLLHWPQWNEFDNEVNRLKKINAEEKIEQVLEKKYVELKEYLKGMVDVARTKAQELVKSIESSQTTASQDNGGKSKTKKPEKESVVMEIYCSRSQFNELILRYPLTEQNNTIFNSASGVPRTISINTYDLKTILRYFNIKISFITKEISFTYQMSLNYQHTLVNKKHSSHAYEKTKLNDDLQKKNEQKTKKAVSVSSIHEMLSSFKLSPEQRYLKEFLAALTEIFQSDFRAYEFVDMPGRYRKYISKYPHVRYSCVDSGVESSKYDLQMEEVVTPLVSYAFTYMESRDPTESKQESHVLLTVGCLMCSPVGDNVAADNLLEHFNGQHHGEKPLVCTNCSKTLNVYKMGQDGWYHGC